MGFIDVANGRLVCGVFFVIGANGLFGIGGALRFFLLPVGEGTGSGGGVVVSLAQQ